MSAALFGAVLGEADASELTGSPEHHHNTSSSHEISQYHLSHLFEIAIECINSLAGLIVLFAVILAGVNLVIIGVNVATGLPPSPLSSPCLVSNSLMTTLAAVGIKLELIDPLHYNNEQNGLHCMKSAVLRIRLMMGEQIALALGLLVASDIIDTILRPTHAYELVDVMKMGFLTVLRTGLAYFLSREIKELEEDHEHHKSKLTRHHLEERHRSDSRKEHAHARSNETQAGSVSSHAAASEGVGPIDESVQQENIPRRRTRRHNN
eukprot:scaffold2297_cov153-Ochromonas_danica.AAC.11